MANSKSSALIVVLNTGSAATASKVMGTKWNRASLGAADLSFTALPAFPAMTALLWLPAFTALSEVFIRGECVQPPDAKALGQETETISLRETGTGANC